MESIRSIFTAACQRVGSHFHAPSRGTAQLMMFGLGVVLLSAGLSDVAFARNSTAFATYNDARVSNSVNMVLTYLEGSFGALIMVAAGISAILSAAFGQYRAALGCLVVAVGSFILRSFLSTFFNDSNITGTA